MTTVNELLAQAQSCKRAGDVEKAITCYKELISKFPFSVEAVAAQMELRQLQASSERLIFNRETGGSSPAAFPSFELKVAPKSEPREQVSGQAPPGALNEKFALSKPVLAGKVILTTASSIEGYVVVKTIDIITAECAFGMNMFRDFFASVTDIVGGRSSSTQKVLRDARVVCLAQLREEAVSRGANAVIAVDLDYSEFSGQGKSMLFLVASGTAVQVKRVSDETTSS